ncbi:MAG: tryptophan synthase subunit alpha [Bacteroidales bacterium]|nr:tryptophan synthase subunit alpha [Bacteroidales bacterium]
MNRIDELFLCKRNNILSIYFTAGYPELNSTATLIKLLAEGGADMIEIGMPFSDPLADGPVIQRSNETALRNGISLKILFNQLSGIRKTINIPLLLMGYLNPVLRFGIENFCKKCSETGIDGVILPDLPPEIYKKEYSGLFSRNGLYNILLISPRTDNERVRIIDSISRGFVYMVSSSSTTGVKGQFTERQIEYFRRIKEMNLLNPLMIGFGISDNSTFKEACQMANGAIVGSAFIKFLSDKKPDKVLIEGFIDRIRNSSIT